MKQIVIAIFATLLYLVSIELLVSWVFIALAFEIGGYEIYFQFIQGLLQLSFVILFIYIIRQKTLKNLISKTEYKWYLLGFFLGITFVFIQTPLNWGYNYIFSSEYNITYDFDGFPAFFNLNIIPIIFFLPITEELFFRGFIQNYLQKNINPILSIFIAAILFALIHAPFLNLFSEWSNQDWHLFYITLFGGAISGILYFKSKSIGPSIVFHIFWNVMVYVA